MDAFQKRKLINKLVLVLSTLAALFGLMWLFWILGTLLYKGLSSLSLEVFIGNPPAPGDNTGGLKHAIVGQTLIVLLATVIGIPIGILAGTYLSEYGKGSKLANWVRDLSDIMMSVPSIVIGTFIYAVLVKPVGHFMGIAGSVALAIMMIPIILRTTDDMLRMVPPELREAAYALGATKFQVIKDVVYRAAITGILTGVILAVARIGGETAPLLFTSFNNNFFTLNIFQPMASLTVTMYDYAMSPYKYWQQLAWAAAIILTFGVLGANILGRIIAHYKFKK
ncbi:phosphate ABC transporter permease PstA [Thermovibrio ammonificans]|uniref:Phosphate transport system permease protein PstA n=1 Tax=Thermovibrio ammonificans (strain DSM 15698 / JCM 12110 / HB-1) TaxID=648996 RepID=E8T4K3_THEA1|nr:phosphate ABC transporter permease PstA [Thermovibrio ammonificans]ADU97461.1 phosphate ABC transporter, inner membrane subunit PstA [Thermovibrio ammonificans HB-1]